MEQLRDMPAVGSGRANQVPRTMANVIYLVGDFAGSTYVVAPVEEDDEESPEGRFRALIDAARRSEDSNNDYLDSPEQAQDRAELTRALYQSQAEAISARDDRRQ
jgi:hypothetical protein